MADGAPESLAASGKELAMRLDARAFGTAAGIVAAVLFIVCALAVAVAPVSTTAFASYLVHMDLSGMARTVTLGSFFGGVIVWTLGTGLTFGLAAAIYNRLVTGASTTRVSAATHPAGQPV
jgi:membrane protein YqaA with SNARE-associated domain